MESRTAHAIGCDCGFCDPRTNLVAACQSMSGHTTVPAFVDPNATGILLGPEDREWFESPDLLMKLASNPVASATNYANGFGPFLAELRTEWKRLRKHVRPQLGRDNSECGQAIARLDRMIGE